MTTASASRVTAVIVNYRTPGLALQCLDCLLAERSNVPLLQVVIVDNASGDGSADEIGARCSESVFRDWTSFYALSINGGFGWANNQAIIRTLQQGSRPDFFYLINPDATPLEGAIASLLTLMKSHPKAAAAGSQLIEPDGRTAGSAFRFPNAMREFFRAANTPRLERLLGVSPGNIAIDCPGKVDWVAGTSVMLRTTSLIDVGLFDHGYFLYFEEVDLMRRLDAAGWEVWFDPQSRVMHIGGAATGLANALSANQRRKPAYWFEARRRYFALWSSPLAANCAWFLGYAFWKLRVLAGFGRASDHAAGEAADMWRSGVRSKPADRRKMVGRWDDLPGRPPAWSVEA